MKIKVHADYGWVGAEEEFIIEVDDDATDEEIEAEAWSYATERVGVNWEVVK